MVKSHSFATLHYNECKTIPDLNLSFTVCGLRCIVFILACNFRSLPLYKLCSDTTEYIEVSRLRIGLSASLNSCGVLAGKTVVANLQFYFGNFPTQQWSSVRLLWEFQTKLLILMDFHFFRQKVQMLD